MEEAVDGVGSGRALGPVANGVSSPSSSDSDELWYGD